MAEGSIGGTPISELPPSSFAYCEPGDGAVSVRCHFPIRDKNGKADPAHVRNALARLSGSQFESKARPKVEAAAKECGIDMPAMAKAWMPIKAGDLDPEEEDAFWRGKLPRPLLAIPFGGPIPSPESPRGVDLDGEFFSENTDIFGPYKALRETRERLVDWHHSLRPPSARHGDPTGVMNTAVLGKAVLRDEPDDMGWWVDFWVNAGEKRVALIRKIAERATLYGSSQPIGETKKAKSGEITLWPFALETLSTAPQNTTSAFRSAKAVLEDAELAGIAISGQMRSLLANMRDLEPDLDGSSLAGDHRAKAGRELSGINEEEIAAAIEALSGGYSRLQAMLDRIRAKYRKE